MQWPWSVRLLFLLLFLLLLLLLMLLGRGVDSDNMSKSQITLFLLRIVGDQFGSYFVTLLLGLGCRIRSRSPLVFLPSRRFHRWGRRHCCRRRAVIAKWLHDGLHRRRYLGGIFFRGDVVVDVVFDPPSRLGIVGPLVHRPFRCRRRRVVVVVVVVIVSSVGIVAAIILRRRPPIVVIPVAIFIAIVIIDRFIDRIFVDVTLNDSGEGCHSRHSRHHIGIVVDSSWWCWWCWWCWCCCWRISIGRCGIGIDVVGTTTASRSDSWWVIYGSTFRGWPEFHAADHGDQYRLLLIMI
mmetsp:Transcript_4532/g.8788  ORF Transcript_4532/g.8788 Transcript_4532/m.8788 type:complete len:294 (-) Transcript_4532:27-908(-)